MSTPKRTSRLNHHGFTMVEVMVASAISTMVLIGLITFFVSTFSYWHGVNLRMEADSDVNIAMSRMVYGMGGGNQLGLRAAAAESVTIIPDGSGGWTVNYDTGGFTPQEHSFTYSVADRSLVFDGKLSAGRDIAAADIKHPLDSEKNEIKSVLIITLRVDKEQGKLKASREIDTKIHFRNSRN